MVYILNFTEFTPFLENFILTPKGQATIDLIICKMKNSFTNLNPFHSDVFPNAC